MDTTKDTAQPPSPTVTLEEAKAELFAMLEEKTTGSWEQVSKIQKACMRLPSLSVLLTGEKRCQLYEKLLRDEQTEQLELPANLSEFAERASEKHEAIAKKLSELLGPAIEGVSLEELKGFVCFFGTEKGFIYNDPHTSVLYALATQVRDLKADQPKDNLKTLLNLTENLRVDYLINSSLYDKATANLLRLILQYHDPILSVALDQHKIDVGEFLLNWSNHLFVNEEDYQSALAIIDWVLILLDHVMIPYTALAFLIVNRRKILTFRTSEEIRDYLVHISFKLSHKRADPMDPALVDGRRIAPLPVWAGKSLLQNADLLSRNTPASAQKILECCLWPDTARLSKTPEALAHHYSLTPCLPIERSDIAASFSVNDVTRATALDYVMVDSRAKVSFDHASLEGSIFVGDVAGYDEERMELLLTRVGNSRGAHLCVLGTGRSIDEEKNLLKLISMQLVQRGFPYVGLFYAGFKGLIPLIKQRAIRVKLLHPEDMEETAPLFSNAGLETAIQTLSSYLPPKEEVQQKAEQLGQLAKERAEAAKAWGAGLLEQLQEKIAEVRSQNFFNESEESNNANTNPNTASTANPTTTTTATTAATTGAASKDTTLSGRVVRPSIAGAFSMGGDAEEGEDDFDLITSVPKPMKNSLPAEEESTKAAANPPALAAAPSTHVDPQADPKPTKTDEDFDKLFK